MSDPSLARELEGRIEELGFELVELDQAGNRQRPILRLRIDRPDSTPGSGITVEECARVSRALEAYLDERKGLAERYVLEVSSPGVERPLVRRRDWERFAGHEVEVRGTVPLAERSRRLTGTLVGLGGGDGERVVLRLPDGEEVEIPRTDISRANLVYRWGEKTGPS